MISLVRVDNRLIHGQVVEAWLPHLKVARVVVADDEAAHSPLIRAAMGLAVPAELEVHIHPLGRRGLRRRSPPTACAPWCCCGTWQALLAAREGLGLPRTR